MPGIEVNGVTYHTRAEFEAAVKNGLELTPELRQQAESIFGKPGDVPVAGDPPAGLGVQENPDKKPVDAETAARQQSNAGAATDANEARAMADAAANPPTEDKKLEVQEKALALYEQLQENIFGDEENNAKLRQQFNQLKAENPAVDLSVPTLKALQAKKAQDAALQAAKLTEQTVTEGNGLRVTNFANEEGRILGQPQETTFQLTAPTERREVQSKRELRQEIREGAQYTDRDGVVHKGTEDLRATYKGLKADARAAKQEYKEWKKEYDKLPQKASKEYQALSPEEQARVDARRAELATKIGKYVTESVERNDEIVEARQAYKASKGRGVRAEARAIHNTQKKDNDVVDRTATFATKAQYKAAVEADPSLKDHAAYLDDEGIEILRALKQKAEMQFQNPATSNDDVAIKQKWEALAKIEIPLETDSAEEIARKTRINQTALRALAGGDNTISETEKKIMLDADGLRALGIKRGDINHLYKAYGMHHEDRLKGKARDAGAAMLKALPAAAASALAVRFSKATADAFAKATQVSSQTEKLHYCVEAVATAIAHAEASVPGFTYSEFDPQTQREIIKQIAGQYSEDIQTVVEKAIAEGDIEVTAVAKASAEAKAHAKAQPSWGKAALAAAITVGVAGITGFLLSKGEENGVNNGDAKEYKNAQFIQMHSGNAAKNIAQELLELRDQLADKLDGNLESANRQLAEAYGAYEGVQNGVMTLQELAALRDGFKDYVNKYKKPDAKPEPTPPAPEPDPVPPTPTTPTTPTTPDTVTTPQTHDVVKEDMVYTIKPGEILGTIAKAMYPGLNQQRVIEALAKANNLKNANSIIAGDNLVLPVIDGVEPVGGKPRTVRGGRRVRHNFNRGDGVGTRTTTTYEGPSHAGSHSGERVINTRTETYTVQRRNKK